MRYLRRALVGAFRRGVHDDVELCDSVDRGLGSGEPDWPVAASDFTPVEFFRSAADLDKCDVVSVQSVQQVC